MIRLSVFQADGTTAVGTVTNALSVSYGQEVNSVGSWMASIPADSPQALYFGDRYRVKIDIGGEGYVFQGIVTKRVTKVQGETKVLEVSGWSTARELVDLDTGQGFELENDTLDDAFTAILDVEGTWATGTVGSPSLSVWSRRFDGVKLWQGLVKLADMFGVLFREDSRDRTIDAGAFGDDCGLTFKNWEGPIPQDLQDDNPDLVLLNGIEVAIETQDIVTRVEPFGQVQGIQRDRVTLEHATDTTLYTTQSGTRNSLDYYYLVDSTAESTYGRIEASIIVSDVLPLGLDPSTDLVRSANALHGVAATWLSRRKDPLRSYQLRVEGLRHIVGGNDTFLVGQKAKVIYQGASKTPDGTTVWLDLDEDLFIMGYRRTVTADGKSAWQLRVSNVTREVPDSTTKLAEMYEQFEASLTAPWPMITWGGVPPTGRLTPTGMDLLADTSGIQWWEAFSDANALAHFYFVADHIFRALSFYAPELDDEPTVIGLVVGGESGNPVNTQMTLFGERAGDDLFGGRRWEVRNETEEALTLVRESAGNWVLSIRKNGALVEVGGSMKSTGQGPFELSKASVGSSYLGISNQASMSATPETYSATSGTNHNIPMPGGGGEGVYVMVVAARAAITTPSGWDVLTTETNTPTRLAVYFFSGSPASTVGVAIGSSVSIAAHVYRFPGGISVATASGTDINSADPPSHSVTSADGSRVFWIVSSATNASATVSSWPAGYPTGLTTNTGGTAITLASVAIPLDAFTENPGAFTWSTSTNPASSTCGIPVVGLEQVCVLTAVSSDQSGLVSIATGSSGDEDIRGQIRIPAANTRAELIAPILLPANEPVWLKKDGSSGTVRLEMVNVSDLE